MSSFTVACFVYANLSVRVDCSCEREPDLPLLDGEMACVELLFPSRVKWKREVVEKWCCNSSKYCVPAEGWKHCQEHLFGENRSIFIKSIVKSCW